MATENLPISGLYPLTGVLTPNDLLVISQQKPEGWKSFHVDIEKFVDLVIDGMNDGSVFMRKVHLAENSGMTGSGLSTDMLSLDWSYLRTQFAPANVGSAYVTTDTRVIAGNGLTGGGDLTANRTLTMGTPSTITSTTTNTVTTESHTHAIEKASTAIAGVVKLIDTLTSTSTADAATARTVKELNDAKVEKSTAITAGNGLTGGGDLTTSRTITLGTPGNLTESTTNAVTAGSHTHFLVKASTSEAGIVKLNDTLVSTSVVEAATARQAKALNDSKADKTVAISVGWGLTGGGNLAANRTIELNLAQLDTRYAASGVGGSYVPLTRSLTAGTGLSGGGDLSANRSFSVVYGTDAGTVAQGNDSRINNGQTAFSWGSHASAGYLKTVALRSSSGLVGTGVDTTNGLGLDYNTIDARYVKSSGGTITGDLTVTGNLNASNLDQGIPTGTILWFNCPRASLPDGFVALDGQLVNRADFPDLWAMVNGNRLNRVTDAAWLGTGTLSYRSCFSLGNGSSTFRMPDLNGVSSDSLKSPVLRGDGYRAGGAIMGDAIRNITGIDDYGLDADLTMNLDYASGAFHYVLSDKWSDDINAASIMNYWNARNWYKLRFDASKVVPTSDENRPVSAFGVYAVKARGGTSTIPAAGSPATTLANTFNGSQKIVGDLEVTGNVKFPESSMANFPFFGGNMNTKIYFRINCWNDARTARLPNIDTGERAYNTTYTNTSNKPKLIYINADVGDAVFRVGDQRIRVYDGDGWCQFNWVIMPGETYGLYHPDGWGGLLCWTETV